MATIHLHRTTSITAEQYIAALTYFGPGRSKLFGNSADEYLKMHQRGLSEADVTEGSGGVWERLHYDWSDPNRVVLTTTDSNVWGGSSGHTYTFTRRPDGSTDIDVVVVRDGKNLKGWLLGLVLGTVGRRVLKKAFTNSVKAVEARTSTSRESWSHAPATVDWARRVNLSLYYLAGYTLPVGLALMFVPQLTMQLLFSNHVYDDLGLRIGGVFLFSLGLIVAGMIIREVSRAYVITLFVRAFIITALLTLFIQYRDPALLATSTVVTIGWILTFLGWRKDTAEQRG